MAGVGRIARAHGIRGQVIVSLETDFPEERFRLGAELFVERNGAIQALTLTSVRFHRHRPVVGIAGVETMTEAEALAGRDLRVPVDRLAPLPGGTFYRHDLIGCRVETPTGELVGTVETVEGTLGGESSGGGGDARRGVDSARRGDLHHDRPGGEADRRRSARGLIGSE